MDGIKIGQVLAIGIEGQDCEHVTVVGFGSTLQRSDGKVIEKLPWAAS